MPVHRTNKAPWSGSKAEDQEWFKKNTGRQRARKKMRKESKRKNRPK